MTEDWTKEWERRVVNGVYPLRRFLARSSHSVVFLTECKAQNVAQAAIKILPADPALAETQLSYWRRVSTLSHPRLIRIFDTGRCELGGHKFLFVVMEYAEQNLGQILPHRGLTVDETRDLLPGVLDGLAYLHGKNLVQGACKPPNLLVVDDQLKLASDTIRPAGERHAGNAKPTVYDPPESKNGRMGTPGDMWALGITLVEALTQSPPDWSRERADAVSLPANLPPEYADAVGKCLSRSPAQRPTVGELAAQFKHSGAMRPESAATPPAPEPLVGAPPAQRFTKTRFLITAGAVALMTVWIIWAGTRFFHAHAAGGQPATAPQPPLPSQLPAASQLPASQPSPWQPPGSQPRPQTSTPPAAAAPRTAPDNPRSASPSSPIVHQEMPDVSRTARESIHGIIKVGVRVALDRAGNVAAAALENPASSKYFTRVAVEAARKWKFVPADDQASRVWLLRFEFTRAGTAAHAAVFRP